MPLGKDVDLDVIAEKTNGFVGADLAALCREAAYAALRRSATAKPGGLSQTVFDTGHDKIEVTSQDFESALGTVAPSAMHEFMVEMSKVSWSDIGGLDDVKRLLQENVVVAMQQAKELSRIGIKPAKGILLFGPPGTGKTLLAKAIAGESHSNFISVRGPEVKSKWYGESEEKIRYLFSKARQVAPCIIFFDELDALVPARGRLGGELTDSVVNQILAEIDGIQSAEGVIVVGATNRIELLDPAVLRPGRFDYHVEVPLPDLDSCRSILKICLAAMPGRDTIPLDEMSQKCRGLSGAEIAEAYRRSGWIALREVGYDARKVSITARHLEQAISEVIQNQAKMKPKTIGFQV
jgi:transitional endoplasmic reticulum ATPase